MTRLDRFFRLYNRKYFNDALPKAEVRWADWPDTSYFGHYFYIDHNKSSGATERYHVIELGKWSCKNNSIWRMTLLHEMIHLKLHDKSCKSHGHLFQREMKRLANMGAFNGLW